MARKRIETIISERISPYSLNEKGQADIARLVKQYPYELLKECIDIGVASYFRYDENGELTQLSVNDFLNNLGGIAFNKSRSPIDQEISHLVSIGKMKFSYWNKNRASQLLHNYVKELRSYWSETDILEDLKGDTARLMGNSKNWSQWTANMEQWIVDVRGWKEKDTVTIEQLGTILPNTLFEGLLPNFQSLCKQINASYEGNLYDCTAVLMRRLLECLLVLSFQKAGIESEIMDKNGNYHISLDGIIKNASQNSVLALSANTKKDMSLFKDLGNYSAHKIWYNCTQQDIKPHILKYRVVIEELLYKSGMKY